MKTAISIPDSVYQSAEKLANRLGQSRSQLYTKAIASYIEKNQNTNITERLDQIYSTDITNINSTLQDLQTRSLLKNSEW